MILFCSLIRPEKKLTLDRCDRNITIYRHCLANAEIKVVCEEKKEKNEFLAKTYNSLRPSSTTSDTSREEYNIHCTKNEVFR